MNRAEVRRRQAGELSNIITLAAILILGRRIGHNGIVYMAAALGVCGLIWTIVGGNLPDGLGRLLRSRRNKGQFKNADKMCKSAMLFQLFLGLAGSGVLCAFGGKITEAVTGMGYSGLLIMLLSPVIFLRSLSAVFMGYFQGDGSEVPTAAARILRSVFILGFGLLFSAIMGDYGERAAALLRQENYAAMYKGAGIAFAVSLAETFVLAFLAFIYKAGGYARKRNRQEGGLYSTDSSFECIRYLWSSRWVQAVTAFLQLLPLTLGLLFYCRRMEDENAMVLEYGSYAGSYLALCAGVVCILSVLMLPVVAKIFISLRKSEHRFARTIFQSGMHICVVHGIFLSVYTAVMAQQIAGLLVPENEQVILPMLQGGSFIIAFGALAFYFSRFLQTAGRKYHVLLAAAAADGLFAVIVMITGSAGILSLVYGGLTAVFVFCIVLGACACGQLRLRINWLAVLVIPAAAGAGAGLVCALLGGLIAPHMNEIVTLFVVFVIASAVYWGALVLLRSFKDQEIDIIPGGRMINALRQMLHLY